MAERDSGDVDRPDIVRMEPEGAVNSRQNVERRRSARFLCGGRVRISRLPSNGISIPGTIRDLSLGGCWIDTVAPIESGARAEIVVHMNAGSFRAIGEVREIRGNSGTGLEFVHLSSGGKDMLADVLAQMAKLQAIMDKLKSARDTDAESLKQELEDGTVQAVMSSERFPVLGTILGAENSEAISEESQGENSESEPAASARKALIAVAQPLVITVNLFG